MEPVRPSLKTRTSPLPSYSNAIEEKHHLTTRPSRFFTHFYIPMPGRRRVVVPLPIPPSAWIWMNNKFGRKRASIAVWIVLLVIGWLLLGMLRSFRWEHRPRWTKPIIGDPPTLVYGREDLRRIWNWEIASGHYPSKRPSEGHLSRLSARSLTDDPLGVIVPDEIRMAITPLNPGIPPSKHEKPNTSSRTGRASSTIGIGSKREYLNITTTPPNVQYPPRVPPGSVADLDVIMDNCDFSQQKVSLIPHVMRKTCACYPD